MLCGMCMASATAGAREINCRRHGGLWEEGETGRGGFGPSALGGTFFFLHLANILIRIPTGS